MPSRADNTAPLIDPRPDMAASIGIGSVGVLIAVLSILLLSLKELLGSTKRDSPRLRRMLNLLVTPLLVVFMINVVLMIMR